MSNVKISSFSLTKILSLTSLIWIASGHFFPLMVSVGNNIIPINGFSEIYLIPAFAVWRMKTEKDTFQRKRIRWMMFFYLIYWVTMPIIISGNVIPLIDGTKAGLIPSYHAIGSVGFFLFFIAVILFGKRADCGWNCTCVFTRETLAFAFRDKTKKSKFWWKLRHLKWLTFAMVWIFFISMVINPETTTQTYGKPMYRLILDIYYITILLIPFTGHRNICRFLCPWAATWGVLSKLGPYKITADVGKCINCGICDRECDMGIPVQKIIKETGVIDTIECMGCERCVTKCPKDVLKVVDFRDSLPGFNLSSMQRGIRVVVGLTLFLLPFLYSGVIFKIIGIFSVLTFFSGLFGYCPFISLVKSKKNQEFCTKK